MRLPTGSNALPPKGQACTHILQRTQVELETTMAPVSGSRVIDPVGQAFWQKASSH